MNSHVEQAEETAGTARNIARRISRFALEQRSRLREADRDGVYRLMWAILKETLRCYQRNYGARTVHGQRLFRDAHRWIYSEDISWLFSFESICLVLGIDSDRLRCELSRWRRLKDRAEERGRRT